MPNAGGLWRRICSVGGVATEVLGIDATSGAPRLQVVVIPGNPGSSVYFKPFMAALHARLGGHAEVVAVTHAGHDPETDTGGQLWDLSQQVGHKVAFLREHVLLPGRPPVVLVGHSIGAAMMVQAVAQLDGLSGEGGRAPEEGLEALNPLAFGLAAPALTAAPTAADALPAILKAQLPPVHMPPGPPRP
ncbi:hypothetical protein TSOC_013145 [Tetrabaena socialis]|uniref:Lipid droplet-associated hydrolase n=1 Tax=Tetrabaena socialis TaxID=47790 RepID=A0A2J7ZL65_9CHLO|nr:hypothetical protein TSOC_013145 [Tetrabaena socialis]|eukprot:PNH00990.1 hypothetical protein TSOC_013145 [Tetrabaena socialis]